MSEDMIVPGNNRAVQKRRAPRRKLFGKRAKEAFLAHFAGTANVAASAEAVGFGEGAVYQHRAKDPEFRAAYWMALEQAAGKLAALRLQHEIARAEGKLAPGIEAAMDGPPDPRQIADLVKLMAALSTLCRNLAGEPRPGGRTPERASIEETVRVLSKRLKAFGVREEARESGTFTGSREGVAEVSGEG